MLRLIWKALQNLWRNKTKELTQEKNWTTALQWFKNMLKTTLWLAWLSSKIKQHVIHFQNHIMFCRQSLAMVDVTYQMQLSKKKNCLFLKNVPYLRAPWRLSFVIKTNSGHVFGFRLYSVGEKNPFSTASGSIQTFVRTWSALTVGGLVVVPARVQINERYHSRHDFLDITFAL